MRFLIDAQLPPALVPWLTEQGHHAEHVVDYGVSAIALGTTGSERTEGLRACTSLIQRSEFPVLSDRLAWFHRDHQRTPQA